MYTRLPVMTRHIFTTEIKSTMYLFDSEDLQVQKFKQIRYHISIKSFRIILVRKF